MRKLPYYDATPDTVSVEDLADHVMEAYPADIIGRQRATFRDVLISAFTLAENLGEQRACQKMAATSARATPPNKLKARKQLGLPGKP
jgi:hypothetical protein